MGGIDFIGTQQNAKRPEKRDSPDVSLSHAGNGDEPSTMDFSPVEMVKRWTRRKKPVADFVRSSQRNLSPLPPMPSPARPAVPPPSAGPKPDPNAEARASLQQRNEMLNHVQPPVRPVPQAFRKPVSAGRPSWSNTVTNGGGPVSPTPSPPRTTLTPTRAPRPDIFAGPRLSSAPIASNGTIELNLMAGENQSAPTVANRRKQWWVVFVVAVLIVFVAYGIAYALKWQSDQTVDDATEEVDALTAEIAGLSDVAAEERVLSPHAAAVEDALEQQYYWSKFLHLLEDTVIDNVYWTNVTADPAGAVTLSGVAATYGDMIEQVGVLEDHPSVHSVTISSAVPFSAAGDATETENPETPAPTTPITSFTLQLRFDSAVISYDETL